MFERKWIGRAVAAVLVVLLAGCMLLPGRFASDMALRRDGSFHFTYKGEIYLLALSKLGDKSHSDTFEAKPCYTDSMDERPCTALELDAQRKTWAEGADKRKADKGHEQLAQQQAMKAMLGGIAPSDPKAAQEFADRLMRQQGWTSVVSKGDGRFDVVYDITARLDHDFTFPTIERFPLMTPFVTAIRRNDGSVRIDAPAFSASASASPIMGMGLAQLGAKDKGADSTGMPELDGMFTLHTDGEILANNTDEGPKADAGGKRLEWKVDARTAAAPSALVKLGR